MYAYDVSTVGIWVIRVNDNPSMKGVIDLSDRLHSGRPDAAANEDKAKQTVALSLWMTEESLLQNSVKSFR